jgi:hypothetical protein
VGASMHEGGTLPVAPPTIDPFVVSASRCQTGRVNERRDVADRDAARPTDIKVARLLCRVCVWLRRRSAFPNFAFDLSQKDTTQKSTCDACWRS